MTVFDEADDMFHAHTPEQQYWARSSLEDLAVMGSSNEGNFGVLVCGTSASTYDLLRNNASPSVRERYSLARHGSKSVNGDRFKEMRLSSVISANVEQAREIARGWLLDRGLDPKLDLGLLQLARAVTFFVGPTPRNVLTALAATFGTGEHQEYIPMLFKQLKAQVLCGIF
jgi:hypothetical protein